MVYSSRLKQAIGCVRLSLEANGLGLQKPDFATHGEHRPEADAPLIMVACSGGRDSMALAAVTHTVCASQGMRCAAVIVDHGLQAGSRQTAERAAKQCRAFGLDTVEIRSITVSPQARRIQGVEAAARDARYEALVAAAHDLGASAVLLAHTRNDQAETVIMGLMRSSGLDAIVGMPRRFRLGGVLFLRPFLDVTRADTTGMCHDLGIEWWDDPTNGDGFDSTHQLPGNLPLRSRVRHDLIPYLQRFSEGDAVGRLADTADLARRDQDFLHALAERVAASSVRFPTVTQALIDVRGLADEHAAIRTRVIAQVLTNLHIPLASRSVEAIDRLITDWHGQGIVSLPREYCAFRRKHVIRVCQDGAHANR